MTSWKIYARVIACVAAIVPMVASPAASQLIDAEGIEALQQLKVRVYTAFTGLHAADVAAGTAQPAVYTEVGAGELPVSTYHWEVPAENLASLAAAIPLPSGLALTPVRVIREETPRHYITLSVFERSGESQGLHAEWTTYVVAQGDSRPHVLMLETASSEATLDPVDLSSPPAETLTVSLGDGTLDTEIASGASSFSASLQLEPALEPDRWLDESWGATSDIVYWRNGVFDLRSVNGLIANRDVTSLPPERVQVDHQTAWAAFVGSDPRWVLLFDERIDTAIQPWVNAADPMLPLDPTFREELLETKATVFSANETMRAEAIGDRMAEPMADFFVEPTPPSVYLNFEIVPEQREALADAIPLPEGFALAPVQTRRDGEALYLLSLNVYEAQGIAAGFRAEWSAYVTRQDDPAPRYMILEAQSSTLSLDPVNLFTDPADVFDYGRDGNTLEMDVQAPGTSFQATIELPEEPETVATTLSWAEANNIIYWANGVADKIYYSGLIYDRPVLDVPLSAVSITDGTVWADYLELHEVLVYPNQLEFIASPWNNLNQLEKEVPSPETGLLQLASLFAMAAIRRSGRRRRG